MWHLEYYYASVKANEPASHSATQDGAHSTSTKKRNGEKGEASDAW
jgi:hypothetical protein